MTRSQSEVERAARLAAVLSHRDMPKHLQAAAEQFLLAHAQALPAAIKAERTTPPSPQTLAQEIREALESALLLIACYEKVPPLAVAGDERKMLASFDLGDNAARRRAVNDPTGPLCLPLRLWNLLRHRAAGEGDETPPPDRQHSLGERLHFVAGGIKVPAEFDRWLRSPKAAKHYEDWRARRALQRGSA